MAPSSPFTTEHLPPARSELPSLAEQTWNVVTRPVTTLAFWLAILLPVFHVALIATGLETPADYATFGSLLALNVAALVVGHGYGQD